MPKYKVEKVQIGIGTKKTFAYGKPRMHVYHVVSGRGGKDTHFRYPTRKEAEFTARSLNKDSRAYDEYRKSSRDKSSSRSRSSRSTSSSRR